jgi:carbonic anhydrase
MCGACLPRRALLGGLAAAAMLPGLRAVAAPPPTADAPNAISGATALRRLMEGNARYVAIRASFHDFDANRAARAQAQYPIAAILGCADSRVAPEFTFDQGPGALFVVRVAGNVLSEMGTASLEYATQVLGVPLILVLGHSKCGAVAAALQAARDGTPLPGHLPALIGKIAPAVAATRAVPEADRLAATIIENVQIVTKQITDSTPLLQGQIATGKVKVAGGVYDLATGRVRLV